MALGNRAGQGTTTVHRHLPRGHGKSTRAEIIAAALGVRGKRRYCIYVSETQQQADQHVQSIGALLESEAVGRFYPEHGECRLGKYGHVLGWRRDPLSTSGRFTVDAFGLDVATS